MRVITFSLLLNLLIAETTFPGLENWYHPHRMSLTGAGGTVTNITADIANPAALWTLPRLFEVSFVSYPVYLWMFISVGRSPHMPLGDG